MGKDLIIKISRQDIRAALRDVFVDNMMGGRTPSEQEVDKCIEWLKEEYIENYSDDVAEFAKELDEEDFISYTRSKSREPLSL